MPDFAKAEISTTSQDLSGYKTFLKRLEIGQTVSLPLEAGESSRSVMRSLNAAAAQSSVRLARLPTTDGSVRFRVLPPEKRAVNLSEEARRARADKARATRAAKQAGLQDETTGLDETPELAGEDDATNSDEAAHESDGARPSRRRRRSS